MKTFSTYISVLFHPLFIPLMGTFAFLVSSPKYLTPEDYKPLLISLSILTIIIPALVYPLLKKLEHVTHISLPGTRERLIPIMIYLLLLYLVLHKVLRPPYSPELDFFIIGLFGSYLAALILALTGIKISLHLMCMCALITFILGLSVHYQQNLTFALSMLIIACGALATARLYLNRHNVRELVLGVMAGIIFQWITFPYWL